MEEIDVVMLTKNSERVLNECLQSVYENVPVKRLIVVDGFSTDNTLRILEEYNKRYGNVKVIMAKGTRGEAREKGIREVRTDWFMFIDSDVVLCKNWFKKASRNMREDVGAIWGVDIPTEIKNEFLKTLLQHMEARVFDIRGGCHDILIRRDTVKDIKIPSFLHTLEDAYIKEWIEAKNYKVVISYDAYCKHYKNVGGLLSKENRLSTVSELKNVRFVKERLIYAAVFAFVWFLQEIGRNKGKVW